MATGDRKPIAKKLLNFFVDMGDDNNASDSQDSTQQQGPVQPAPKPVTGGPNFGSEVNEVSTYSVDTSAMEDAILANIEPTLDKKGVLSFIKQRKALISIIPDQTALNTAVLATLNGFQISKEDVLASIQEALSEDMPELKTCVDNEYASKIESLNSFDQDAKNCEQELKSIEGKILDHQNQIKALQKQIPDVQTRMQTIQGNKIAGKKKLDINHQAFISAFSKITAMLEQIKQQITK